MYALALLSGVLAQPHHLDRAHPAHARGDHHGFLRAPPSHAPPPHSPFFARFFTASLTLHGDASCGSGESFLATFSGDACAALSPPFLPAPLPSMSAFCVSPFAVEVQACGDSGRPPPDVRPAGECFTAPSPGGGRATLSGRFDCTATAVAWGALGISAVAAALLACCLRRCCCGAARDKGAPAPQPFQGSIQEGGPAAAAQRATHTEGEAPARAPPAPTAPPPPPACGPPLYAPPCFFCKGGTVAGAKFCPHCGVMREF